MRWCWALLLLLVANHSTAEVILLDLGQEGPTPVRLLSGGTSTEQEWNDCPVPEVPRDPGAVENAIYMLDAATGYLLWRASGPGGAQTGHAGTQTFYHPQLIHGVAAPLTPVDSNGNGVIDRAYVADVEGTLWRVDMPEAGSQFQGPVEEVFGTFSVTPVAELGGEGADDRQFFHQADYVRSRDDSGDYEGILLVSGDGAGPAASGVQNYAYLVKDRNGPVVTHEQLLDITQICARRENAECRSADVSRGWKLALAGAAEKGVSRPLVSRGVVYFSTWTPAAQETMCDIESGSGEVYAVSLIDGSPATWQVENPGDQQGQEGGAPSVRSVPVGQGLPGPVVPQRDHVLLPGSGDAGNQLVSPGGAFRWRIYWREEGVDIQ